MSFLNKLFKNKNDEKFEINDHTAAEEDEITAAIAAALSLMDEEEEVVAAITAAIACMLGKSTDDFIVKNIKRTSEIDSIWALSGRIKLMR
ncbi:MULTISPECIES: hypothetical protein [unclassified Sedimentibacter]|uniref:hypothetical protein n=1 Tax=unclassified Sedimentibacter TaxID=2649220 RepID=UPI0027E0A27A|nr:hypothetical protein [Sedimentibacter sp. MB35-C1]WMJ76704.1 hypothetical protein RBQ61_14165 [Sedimentibacter sp. MB35-C1]